MSDKKREDISAGANVELGGMGLYGTTTDQEIAGYKATGDIENAGQSEKLRKEKGHQGATASVKGEHQRGD